MKFSNHSRVALIALLLVLSTLFASCNLLPPPAGSTPQAGTQQTGTPFGTTTTYPEEQTTPPEEITAPEETTPSGSDSQQPPLKDPMGFEIPAYNGEPTVAVNNNQPYFSGEEDTDASYEQYSPLDSLGRCGVAMAYIGKDLMPTEGRKDPTWNPTGWVQASYNVVPSGWLYNRSHLIGWQLTAETNNNLNLMTGTQYFNQSGMLPFENQVADYIKETNNHVLYRITPIFVGDELLARGVLMEAWSVEDNGAGICFNVFVYNVQPNVEIDYATGESHVDGAQGENNPNVPDVGEKCDYIGNKNSKVFHTPDCQYVKTMSDANKVAFNKTREEIIEEGYTPCSRCKP